MKYITIDGDDIGQKITSCYLRNDLIALSEINTLVQTKTHLIADFLRSQDFIVIFCAADGVAAYSNVSNANDDFIFSSISRIAGVELTFSAGIGASLRESYIALISAKSNGKACLQNFESLG